MLSLLRVLHVLAVSLWFGSVAFFSLAGLLIFQAFADVSRLEPDDPARRWLPVAPLYAGPSPGDGFPEPLRLEQGSRAAGVAVSRIFPFFYALQTACALTATATALLLARQDVGAHPRWRSWLCLAALVTVLGGWWLEIRVRELRDPRNQLTDQALATSPPSPERLAEARDARAAFGRWHGYSLLQNFLTLGLVTGLTILLPSLSATGSRSP